MRLFEKQFKFLKPSEFQRQLVLVRIRVRRIGVDYFDDLRRIFPEIAVATAVYFFAKLFGPELQKVSHLFASKRQQIVSAVVILSSGLQCVMIRFRHVSPIPIHSVSQCPKMRTRELIGLKDLVPISDVFEQIADQSYEIIVR